ncbi:MAG: type II toxin-antitoxin system PemK/MazF family toxin [Bryobacterales bacterium]|nr:type II toxin-antitoxin system PemK/MazF family toxin [Bryobacterales bacterium]
MRVSGRGEVWWVRPGPTLGSEIAKTRPCVILSGNIFPHPLASACAVRQPGGSSGNGSDTGRLQTTTWSTAGGLSPEDPEAVEAGAGRFRVLRDRAIS